MKNEITINTLINLVDTYDKDAEQVIRRAYELASYLHRNQLRQSGEPYIIHPLNVALILAEMQADRDTICAALLHDTLEDTETTYDEIKQNFNNEVAKLVMGVTKISKMNFQSKKEENLANTRKIITSVTSDVRIIIIKLADRLHNMRTIQFKTKEKQIENARETLDVFVPLANLIGVRKIKNELEDICLKCIDEYHYHTIENKLNNIIDDYQDTISTMKIQLNQTLINENIENKIDLKKKNIYGIYKKLSEGYKLNNIHDLLGFQILVKEIKDCYLSLYPIHKIYMPVNELFKDYIARPKSNYYQSLHTTVFAPDGRLIQMRIRTKEMESIGTYGLARYWQIKGNHARNTMQEDLKEKYQFYSPLEEIDKSYQNNEDFVNNVTKEVLSEKVYVYTAKGKTLELPRGATIIDFAYYISEQLGDTMIGAIVNDEIVPVDYILKTGDRIIIKTDARKKEPLNNLEEKAFTTHAKKKIKSKNLRYVK